MRRSVVTALMISAGLFAWLPAKAAGPIMGGDWNITTCRDPDRGCGTTCYSFTRVPGHVAGSSTSGRVSVHSPGATFTGKWLQLGDRVTFWGTFTFIIEGLVFYDGAFLSPTGINGENFVTFAPGADAGLSSTGVWRGVKVVSCPQ
jgi:hypothetical protein